MAFDILAGNSFHKKKVSNIKKINPRYLGGFYVGIKRLKLGQKIEVWQKMKYPCANHPARQAAIERHGRNLCWECCLGKAAFELRFGKDFYKDEEKKSKTKKG